MSGGVIIGGVSEGAAEGPEVAAERESGEVFADLRPGCCGGDGSEFAANFGGCGGLHVEAVVLSESAGEEDIDAGFESGRGGCCRLCCEGMQAAEVVHAEPQQGDAAGLNGGAAGEMWVPERTGVSSHDQGGS